jgi:hypothetical protein
MVKEQLIHIQERLDEIYDRVARNGEEIAMLKWKVATIASGLGSATGFIASYLWTKFF